MKFDHASIVGIFVAEEGPPGFRGTGFLVTPNCVLTCAHVLFGDDPDRWTDCCESINNSIPDLRLSFGNDPDPAARIKGTVVACDPSDLALISLDAPVSGRPLPFISGLTSEHEAALFQIRGSVIGFSEAEKGKLIDRPAEGHVSLSRDFHTGRLLTIQISGELFPGMSGSPLVVSLEGQDVCLGVAQLGGDGSATSRLILSDVVLAFLARAGLTSALAVPAADFPARVQRENLAFAAARLKSALDRVLTGANTGQDCRLLQESLLKGSLVFSSSDRGGETGGNSAVIVSGNSYRVIVQIDEESGTALGEKLFPSLTGVAPPPPSVFFVGRSRDLSIVKSLLSQASSHVVVVQGWPGVGKSSFAAVLGRDMDLIASFPDGVLWTAIGQSPNLFASLASWGRSLGIENILRLPRLNEAAAHIQEKLASRRMLLIVDDVWNTEDALPFLGMHSGGCRLLLTTRCPQVVQELTTIPFTPYPLPVLDADDALQLLRNLVPEVVDKNQDVCRILLSDLEHLPLAIHVAGRLLRNEVKLGWSVAELIEEIRSGARIIREKAPEDRAENGKIPTVSALLARSTDLLDEKTREYFAYLGAFAPKPATFALEAMAAVWREKDPKPYVRKLVGHGLLEPALNGRFQMHALLVAHACSLLTD